MGIESKLSGHWTDEQLIDHLYGGGLEDSHLSSCEACAARLDAMQARRIFVEESAPAASELSAEFIAAQRRAIYVKLDGQAGWWQGRSVWRWASAAAALTVVCGLTVLEETRPVAPIQQSQHTASAAVQLSDAQLAEEVSLLADNPEPQPTAPLQALFSE